ncbi:MAG: hypothetical protein CMJ90_00170 [Planctomycetes bacterium]|nr:hypothetical protein [Planctomycetota bacterium]
MGQVLRLTTAADPMQRLAANHVCTRMIDIPAIVIPGAQVLNHRLPLIEPGSRLVPEVKLA